MLDVLRNRTFRRLFTAQVVTLLGTGLATVALGLLALDIAGEEAGAVLGTALAIKMVAYVGLAPIVGGIAPRLNRRNFLIAMAAVRGLIVITFPFVTEVWQIYVLVFFMQAAAAAYTPTFQATIPDIVADEEQYTDALSLSRLAYDLEALLSPLAAAALLTVISFTWLFSLTAVGFAISALIVAGASLPRARRAAADEGWRARTARGLRIYLRTPRLRGLMGLNFAVAAGGAMVIVNTVVIVGDELGRSNSDIALTLAAYGAGSMAVALLLPRLLRRRGERGLLLAGGLLLTAGLLAGAFLAARLAEGEGFVALLVLWVVLGCGASLVLTPAGRLLRRSAHSTDLPALFAAQFALSHACWLITYPLAGRFGAAVGISTTFVLLAVFSAVGVILASTLWRSGDEGPIAHVHTDLPPDHPHLAGAESVPGGWRHTHTYVIDAEHRHWPE